MCSSDPDCDIEDEDGDDDCDCSFAVRSSSKRIRRSADACTSRASSSPLRQAGSEGVRGTALDVDAVGGEAYNADMEMSVDIKERVRPGVGVCAVVTWSVDALAAGVVDAVELVVTLVLGANHVLNHPVDCLVSHA